MATDGERDLKAWFARSKKAQRTDVDSSRHLQPTSTNEEIAARWAQHLTELGQARDPYPWFCDAVSDPYGREHVIRIYFEESFARRLPREKGDYRKDLEAIVRYGYRGASRGGINGILLLKYDGQNGVGRKYEELVESNFARLAGIPAVSAWIRASQHIEGCKVVSHGRHGRRIVGLLDLRDEGDRTTGEAVFFDVWSYTE